MRSVIVSRIRRLSRLLPAAALLALGLGPAAAPALAAAHQAPAVTHKTVTHKTVTAAGAETLTGTLPDGATYLIQVPANWNGTLFLYSHGYVVPGSPNPATDVGDPITGAAMLAQGFALAGSSYASTGWAIQQALPDQISTLNIFDSQVGHPKRTIAWGHSLGGIITAGLIQKYPSRFAGALPMCGVLSGGVATWNTALDSEFAFQQLIDPSVQVVNITIPPTDPTANLTAADTAAAAMRGRIRALFTELHTERELLDTQLAALTEVTPQAADLTMLDELPMPGDIVPGLPPDLKARLFQAFDLHILWNKPGQQATVHAEITDATLRALPAILDPSRDGYDDTAGNQPEDAGSVEHLFDPPIRGLISHNNSKALT